MYFKLVGILWTFVGIREHMFVLHVMWEEKCLKQAEPFLMWLILKVPCTTIELHIRKSK